MIEIKEKIAPEQATKTKMGNKMYNSTLPLTFDNRLGGWSTPRPGRFTPGKDTRYAFNWRLGGSQGRSGRVRKNSPPAAFEPRTVQPVASRYIPQPTVIN
jgi:hypothetical protein